MVLDKFAALQMQLNDKQHVTLNGRKEKRHKCSVFKSTQIKLHDLGAHAHEN